jgi:hypothetical protein
MSYGPCCISQGRSGGLTGATRQLAMSAAHLRSGAMTTGTYDCFCPSVPGYTVLDPLPRGLSEACRPLVAVSSVCVAL